MPDIGRTVGQLAQLACTWEVLARKAGNVCPGREFPDLTVDDFLQSAAAIAPILDQAPHRPLGLTILRAIEATRAVVNTNTNLGIVLLLSPLAAIPLGEPIRPGLARILEATSVEDSRNVYAAIRLARPGGLGNARQQDIRQEPTLPLRDVMTLAEDQDLVASQYSRHFELILDWLTPELVARVRHPGNIERAILDVQLAALCRFPDSLIARKRGLDEAIQVRQAADSVLALGGLHTSAGRRAFCELDTLLRSDRHARNPGTTADLIAAALFVALRDRQIKPDTPFAWDEHPFGNE